MGVFRRQAAPGPVTVTPAHLQVRRGTCAFCRHEGDVIPAGPYEGCRTMHCSDGGACAARMDERNEESARALGLSR